MQSKQALNGPKSAYLGYFKNNWVCKNLILTLVGFGTNIFLTYGEEINNLGDNTLPSLAPYMTTT